MKNIVIVFTAVLFLSACAMKRENPLDPVEHDIHVPNEVIGISVSKSNSEEIVISWITQDDADGYYIYRSLSIDGYYDRIDNDMLNSSQIGEFTDDTINSGKWYFYKMSAYLVVNGRKLEGWRSGPKTW